jgi:hypothetical protein
MMYLLFIDGDSDSVGKIADVIHDKLLDYLDMTWNGVTDGNRTLVMIYDENEYKNPRIYVTVTYSINEYNDRNRDNYNQRGVVTIETNDLDKYGDMLNIVNSYIRQNKCEIEELHPMMYMDYDYEPVELIAEDVKAIYLRFTCRKEENKESGKTGE